MKFLPRLHFWTGFIGVLVFLLTGQYMFHVHDHLAGMADGPRMLYRSSHIYLLLTSIMNLLLGVYLPASRSELPSWLQNTLSVVFLLSPWIILAGFFLESQNSDLRRPVIHLGLYALFALAALLMIYGVWRRK
jgi:hypothetical protein